MINQSPRSTKPTVLELIVAQALLLCINTLPGPVCVKVMVCVSCDELVTFSGIPSLHLLLDQCW